MGVLNFTIPNEYKTFESETEDEDEALKARARRANFRVFLVYGIFSL
jgi:hypothetical protein